MLRHGHTIINNLNDRERITCIDTVSNILVAGTITGDIKLFHFISGKTSFKLLKGKLTTILFPYISSYIYIYAYVYNSSLSIFPFLSLFQI